ncbi:endolysin [Yersinia phage vB_Yen_X1]|nr:endolysin [Yersinia phage vB_Yen_X1]
MEVQPIIEEVSMGFKLGSRSLQRLQGVHPDLVKVVKRAIEISPVDFTVTEGLRTLERQKELFAKGASKTMRSRHLTGHAVDISPLVGGKVSWDWKYYYPMADAMKQAAKELGVNIEWGGDWKTFKDGPHFQLPHAEYK